MRAMHFNQFPSYKAYADHVHELNHVWCHDESGVRLERDKAELVMLMVSELAEAMEGARKDLMDDHLPEYKMFAVELADTIIRALDYAGAYGHAIEKSTGVQPLAYNSTTIGNKLLELCNFACDIIFWEQNKSRTECDMVSHQLHALITGCAKLARDEGFDNIWDIVLDKLLYNQKRADHTYAERAKAGGKKF